MKRFIYVVAFLMALYACQSEPYHDGRFRFDRQYYEISYRGGEVTVEYGLTASDDGYTLRLIGR